LRSARNEENPVLRWVPWLCAHRGARVAEVCQLRKENVLDVDGTPCLRITAEAGPLKTPNSARIIAIHSALIAEGFLRADGDAGVTISTSLSRRLNLRMICGRRHFAVVDVWFHRHYRPASFFIQ
jgi:hypothetical protein